MSWGYRIFGSSGLGFSTLLIGATTIALLIRWVWREWGVGAAWLTLALIMGSSMFIWYSTGLFIESPLLLIEVIWLYSLPISRRFAHHRYWYYVNVLLIVLMGFTRQSPLLPMAVLTGGWFAQFLQTKKIRNSWFGITLLGGARRLRFLRNQRLSGHRRVSILEPALHLYRAASWISAGSAAQGWPLNRCPDHQAS